ncbi:MAG: glycosyltransferase family 2 protein [Myxococcales bacterium]|nr:glycosyltransferase family 2 protein [Myxococcales bacterium]MCB9700732.1 glycosyltransferase family 2 protein [Myxococcales bacterium]
MKLIIQIPCLNEREHLGATFADLPRSIAGIDVIEVLVIDDGSTDGTAEVAAELGVHHVLRFPRNRGLAAAYAAGIDACIRLGADVIVNTDADNQYRGADIPRLCAPILAGEADIAIGDRQTDTIAHFSLLKKILQRWGSRVVRRASGTAVVDATSGFRALSRRAAATLFVHNRFTYTLETIIQAGQAGLVIANIPITTNPMNRPSRLFKSIAGYVRRNGAVIVRAYATYWPVETFGRIALLLLALGLGLGGRFLYFYASRYPAESGHTESLLVGVGAIVLAFLVALMALLGDLMAANRRLSEELLIRERLAEGARADALQAAGETPRAPGVRRSAAASWRGPDGGVS